VIFSQVYRNIHHLSPFSIGFEKDQKEGIWRRASLFLLEFISVRNLFYKVDHEARRRTRATGVSPQ
jgi:hypothetical protein